MVDFDAAATVSEVAAALQNHLGGADSPRPRFTLVCGGRATEPDLLAATHGPRSGSTIGVVAAPTEPAAAGGGTTSPVAVRSPEGLRTLTYGVNEILPGVLVAVEHSVRLVDDGGGPVSVNGQAVRGNTVVTHGDLLRAGGLVATVEVAGALRPPPGGGPTFTMAVTRGVHRTSEPSTVEAPHPPGRVRMPGFPWLTAVVPLAMGAAAWFLTHSVLMVAFMAFSFVYIVASGIESRMETRATDRFEVQGFLDDIGELGSDLDEARIAQSMRDDSQHPDTAEALGWSAPISHRLWERSGSHPDPLKVRIGSAAKAPRHTVVIPQRGRPDLRGAIRDLAAHNDPVPRPLVVALASTGGLAVIGDEPGTSALASCVVAQLTMLIPPGRLRVILPQTGHGWDWARWLPHSHIPAEHTLTIRTGDDEAPSDRTQHGGAEQPMLWVAPDTVGLPESVRAVVQIDNHGIATLQVDHDAPVEFTTEVVPAEDLTTAARHLAGARLSAPDAAEEAPGNTVTLANLGIHPDPQAIATRWCSVSTEPSKSDGRTASGALTVDLGLVTGGGRMRIDLGADGPHALVAGTTGSGKSELLRTMLLGLAARHPPSVLTMFLIDYKGGAAFGPLTSLPHCVGSMTDLHDDGTDRTLESLRAELRRRESILESHGAAGLHDLADPPPSLVLVVDEFATLVTEAPDFLDGMLDVAQRGRSLGIHLVLATQRPAGVISDSIRANTSLRIALRLPDAHDSDDVIGSPAAAGLRRDRPGVAMVRLGHDELVRVAVAYSGSVPTPQAPVRVTPLCPRGDHATPAPAPREPMRGARSELEMVVAAIIEAAAGTDEPHRPVPAPLPRRLDPASLHSVRARAALEDPASAALTVGLVDRPDLQRQDPLTLDPRRRGGILVVGTRCSGATTTLATVARVAQAQWGWRVHAIDGGGGITQALDGRSADLITDAGDHEGVRRLLQRALDRPPLDDRSGGVVLLIDGYGGFEQAQEKVNRGWAIDMLTDLASRGVAEGVLVAVTARRRAEVPPSLLAALGERVALRSVDEDEAAVLDAPPDLARAELPPGRAWVDGRFAQLLLTDRSGGGTPRRPPRLTARVGLDQLPEPRAAEPWHLPVGIRADDLGPAWLDLTASHVLVTGAPHSGRTTALASIAAAARRCGTEVVEGDPDGPTDVSSLLARAARHQSAAPGARVLVIVDDLADDLDDPRVTDRLAPLLGGLRDSGTRLAMACEPLTLMGGYDPVIVRLRSMRTGIVLGPGAYELGDVVHQTICAREDIGDAPGRGWLVCRGDASLVQIATP